MTKHFMLQKGGALWPDDETGLERLRRLGDDTLVEVDVKQRRNIKFSRKFWKMMTLVWTQTALQDRHHDVEALVRSFKLEIGVVVPTVRANGEVRVDPGSIAFDKMDEAEFEAFYTNAVKIIVRDFLGGGPDDEIGLRNEIEEIIR